MTWTAIFISGEEEYQADFASGQGLTDFRAAVEANQCPTLQHWLDNGWADNLDHFRVDLTRLQRADILPTVRASIDVLSQSIADSGLKIVDAIVLGNGVTEDTGEDIAEALQESMKPIAESLLEVGIVGHQLVASFGSWASPADHKYFEKFCEDHDYLPVIVTEQVLDGLLKKEVGARIIAIDYSSTGLQEDMAKRWGGYP